jgi:transposase-like protein
MMDNDAEAGYRAKIILLRSEGYTVAEIRRQTNHHDNNIRKWIHRFNDYGIDGIVSSRKHNHTAPKITDDIEKEIVLIASTNPRKLCEILYMVITGFGWICCGKEDSRKYKPC